MMGWGECPMCGMGMMLLGSMLGLLVLVALGVGIWWLVRQARPASSRDTALEQLRQRYARGEITREEFETRRRDLAA
jgi:putative membrane protein